MKEKDRDRIDDLFQAKLREVEIDVTPGDWEQIAARLPRAQSVPLYRRASFWAAAAVAAIFLLITPLYLFDAPLADDPIVQEVERQTEELLMPVEKTPQIATPQPILSHVLSTNRKNRDEALSLSTRQAKEEDDQAVESLENERTISPAADDEPQRNEAAEKSIQPALTQTVETATEQPLLAQAKTRRWGVGMGAGAVSVGTNNVVPSYLVNTMGLRGEDLLLMNDPSGVQTLPKTDVHHDKPLSFGIGISYLLNNRISLQTGLAYTYLSSEWRTNDEYRVKTKQRLHFVGIPLGMTYRIATWKRFNLYASAGVQVDVNVAGQQKAELVRDILIDDVVIEREVRSVREKKLLLSANARVGVSYPLLRFLSAYVEGGAGYYFDNNSALFDKMGEMPTYYSEKPFNLTLQAGFRLGF